MPARAPSSARRRRSLAPRQRPCRAAACSRSPLRHPPPCYSPRPPCPIGRRSGFLRVLPRRNAPIFSRLSSRSPTSAGPRLPVSYNVTITNLDGTSGSLASGLRAVGLFPLLARSTRPFAIRNSSAATLVWLHLVAKLLAQPLQQRTVTAGCRAFLTCLRCLSQSFAFDCCSLARVRACRPKPVDMAGGAIPDIHGHGDLHHRLRH